MVRALIESGADVDLITKDERTAWDFGVYEWPSGGGSRTWGQTSHDVNDVPCHDEQSHMSHHEYIMVQGNLD